MDHLCFAKTQNDPAPFLFGADSAYLLLHNKPPALPQTQWRNITVVVYYCYFWLLTQPK